MRVLLFLALVSIFASCDRNKVENQNTSLLGKWKLTAFNISNGGPSTWQDANPSDPSYVTFTPTGKMIFSSQNIETRLDYLITEDGKFSATRDSSTFNYWYTLQGNVLELNGGGCIEQCSSRYKRVSGTFD